MYIFFKCFFLCFVLAGIFFLSHQPSIAIIPPLFPFQDKVFHIVEFSILGWALWINRDLFGNKYMLHTIIIFSIFWAGFDEIHQSFVPGRDCTWGDFIADIIGVSLPLIFMTMRDSRIRSDDIDST